MSEQEVFDALKYRVKVDCQGNRFYYNPAGEIHRIGGPAITVADGTKVWYQNGKMHREDGPAVVYPNGERCWYLNGVRYTEHNFKLALESKCKIILQHSVLG